MTDACPIRFATKGPLLPSATPTGFHWVYVDPALILEVDFPVDMDQTVQPLPAEFVILVDAVPKTPDSIGWTTSKILTVNYSEAILGPSVVRLQYPQMFPNFLSLAGQPVFPFDLLGVPT